MAVYKVPQDVEADDKLIGPFSFRQFVYLIIAIVGIAIAWGLSRVFIPLALIPVPIILFFGALALPLRKDQPMEVYLAAVVSFYLKPRRRLWSPDGIQSLVEITVPRIIEEQRVKNLSQEEAEKRLSYLANIVDTEGWAVRGVARLPSQPSIPQTLTAIADTSDVMSDSEAVAKNFDSMIAKADTARHEALIAQLHQPIGANQPPIAVTSPESSAPRSEPKVTFNPYPAAIHQKIISPIDDSSVNASELISPSILQLANNSDLSVETIAHEAQRIHEREARLRDEDVISLR